MPTTGIRGEELAEVLLEMSDELEARFRAEFLKQISALSKSKALRDLLEEIESGVFESGDPIDVRLNRITISTAKLDEAMRQAIARSAKITQETVGIQGAFNVTNPEVINVARNLSVELSTNLNTTARQTIRQIITDAVEGNITRVEAANRIKQLVGLIPQHAKAVENYYNKMLADGVKKSLAKKRAKEYAERLLRYRADTIARTEIARAVGTGQTEYWKQMRNEGFLPPEARRVWITAQDERVCPTCGPMNGVLADIDGFFETGAGAVEYPQATHPRCRCTAGITIVNQKKRGGVRKSDELALLLWSISKANPYKDAEGKFTTKAKAVAPKGVQVRPFSPRQIPKDALSRFISDADDEEEVQGVREDQENINGLGDAEPYPSGFTMSEREKGAVDTVAYGWIAEFGRSFGMRQIANDLDRDGNLDYWSSEERMKNREESNRTSHGGELLTDIATTISTIRKAPTSVVWRGLRLSQEAADRLVEGAVHREPLATATGRKNLAIDFTTGVYLRSETRQSKPVRVLLKIRCRNLPIGIHKVDKDGVPEQFDDPVVAYADERLISGKYKVVSVSEMAGVREPGMDRVPKIKVVEMEEVP
ncbi:MAG: hypothetical protein EBU84_07410 [Actinobacteria bacterium]|nr:hypothetical protein [Actinomycetota bacterium]